MSVGETANFDYTINATNVTFQGRSSLDRFGAVNYYWTFGDGTDFTGQTASHTYAVSGAYNVHLSAAIGSGHAAADALVLVPASPPTITAITDDVLPITVALSNGQTTNDNDLTVKVSLPSGSGVTAASAGDVLQLVDPWQTLTSYTLTASDIANGYATVQTGFLFDGTYDLTAQIVSDGGSGATSESSGVFEVTVDATAPAAPALGFGPGVSDTNGATASEAQFPGAVTVRGTEPGTTITVTFTNGPNTVTKTVSGLGFDQGVTLTAADVAALTDGTILVSAVQTDGVGNASPASTTSFTLDTQAPLPPVLALGTGVAFGGATAAEAMQAGGVVTVSAEAGTTITVNFFGNNVVHKTLIATGVPQVVTLGPGDISFLGDGNITVGAVAQDAAGNSSSPASPAFFTLDTLPPPPGVLIITNPLIDINEVFQVPFVVFGVEVGGSGVVTFNDGTLANTKTVNVFAGTTSYQVDLTGFGRYVTSSLTLYDAAGNSNTSAGNSTIVATSTDLVLLVSEFLSISPSEWRPNPAYTSVTLKDTGFNLGNLTDIQVASLGPAGVNFMQSTTGALYLTVAQYQALGSVALVPTDTVRLRDTNANITGLDFSTLQAGGIDQINATGDNTLTINLAQAGALGAGLTLTSSDVVTLAAPAAALEALPPEDFAALAGKGIDFIHSTDGTLTLNVAQALGAPKLTASDTVTVADDGATISGLTASQLRALATKGVDALVATSGDLAFTRVQFLNRGAMTLAAAGDVVLADTSGQLAALAAQFGTLAANGVDRIDSLTGLFRLSLADYQALGTVALTSSDVVTLADTNANLTGLDFAALKAGGIDKIDAIGDHKLTIDLAQYGALGAGLTLTGSDVVTLADSGNVTTGLSSLSAGAITALAGAYIDKIDATDNQLSFSVAQFQALRTVIVEATDALTVTGDDANDVASFSRQTFTANDSFDGGGGTDTLVLGGDYSAGLTFGTFGLVDVERVTLLAGHSYNLTTTDANVRAGHFLTVNGGGLGALDSLDFDGSAETNGRFRMTGGAGADTLTGGGGNDTITGGDGADLLHGGGGADTFVYSAPSQSTGTTHDTVADFNAGEDWFDFDRVVSGVQAFSGTVSSGGSFDSDLSSIFGDRIHFQSASVVSVNGGNLDGHTLLVVTADTSYLAGSDYVVDITGFSGALTVSNFK
jgi:hypothetical protein